MKDRQVHNNIPDVENVVTNGLSFIAKTLFVTILRIFCTTIFMYVIVLF